VRYNGCVAREETSTKAGRLKAGSRNGPAMPASKMWGNSLAHRGPGSSPDRAVGLDRPELTPLERLNVSLKEEAPSLEGEEVT